MTVTFEPFTVSVSDLTPKEFDQVNTAPLIDSLATQIEVMAGNRTTELIGYPIDLQEGSFRLESLTVVSQINNQTAKDWVTFDAEQNEESFVDGLFVTLSPPLNATGQVFSLVFNLKEEALVDRPLRSTFTVMVKVIEFQESVDVTDSESDQYYTPVVTDQSEDDKDDKTDETAGSSDISVALEQSNFSVLEELDDPVIRVKVQKSNRLGQFKMEFNRYIAAPRNVKTWSSENEGSKKIKIWLMLS